MQKHSYIFLFVLIALFTVSCSTTGNSPAAEWPAKEATDFWALHGIWFLVFMNMFPRFTMLVMTAHPIGFLSWIGWLIAPRDRKSVV